MSFVFVYLDDILVASSSEGEHLTHLRDLFTRLNQHGLILNPAKCLFGLPSIHFLGHLINKDGAAPLPSKVEAVSAFLRPHTARALREFLGMVTFYHRFIRRAAHTMHPLYEALKEDLQSSSAELVYGQTLRVPGDFIPGATVPWSAARQRSSLLEAAGAFTPVPTSQHGTPAFQVPPNLHSAGFVVPAALSMPLPPDLVVGAAAPATPPSSAPVLRTRRGRVIVPPRHRGFDYG
ncbi:hypothetical protein SKAU_G00352880 [Synaphobranchus kaupii]|uniref:ribonuclease H n=1 Tax=Synaphobranchus kaupii TaxID=118154 RepID=A0A9Q1EKV4_SYNKA|nr:hypothetical protein SKAU_G00352880 [Synaphobranchus kaupii]